MDTQWAIYIHNQWKILFYLSIVYQQPFSTKLAFPVEFSFKKFSEYTVYFLRAIFFLFAKVC